MLPLRSAFLSRRLSLNRSLCLPVRWKLLLLLASGATGMMLRAAETAPSTGPVPKATAGAASASTPAPASNDPINPHASPEARALLRFFHDISGKNTLTGQHNTPSQINYWSQRAFDLTGKYPAVFGQDLGFSAGSDKDSVLARAAMLEEIKLQYQRGAVITLTWHAVCPTDDEPVTFRDSVQHKLSDFEWEEVITPGTRLNERWRVQVDEIAGFLRQLRDARIPVLWRPYHEMHGGWFWWGGRPGSRGSVQLYRMLYERFVNVHHLDNLIWVWNGGLANEKDPQGTDFYPGSEYVDILSTDVYGPYSQPAYEQFVQLARNKPIALGEVGVAPTVNVLHNQPLWTYFLIWSEFIDYSNPLAPLKAVFDDPRQLSRGDPTLDQAMKSIRWLAGTHRTPEPVTRGATEQTRMLLGKLSSIPGKQTLSGMDFGTTPQQTYTQATFTETFQRRPAIFAADLAVAPAEGITPETALNKVIDDALSEAKAGAIVSLSWKSPRPSDPDSTGPEQSARGALSDFEWRELLTPGTHLHDRWLAQVDRVAATLKQFQDAGIAVLWRPYPQINVKKFWWGGRRGANGAPALYRMLFERLTEHHHLNNLVWVWTAAPDAYSEVPGTQFHDFLPGHLYFDAIALAIDPAGQPGRRRPPMDRVLARAAADKPVGIELPIDSLRPETFEREPGLSWFIIAPPSPPATPAPVPAAGAGPTPPGTPIVSNPSLPPSPPSSSGAPRPPGTAPSPNSVASISPPASVTGSAVSPPSAPGTAAATSTSTPPPATVPAGPPPPPDPVATLRALLSTPQVISRPAQ